MNTIVEKVKRAALSMQRYNWEQGVLAQAFLESGGEEAAILLAVEAAHRQDELGRCAAIGPAFSATDPCAVGEALIYACEQTGDPSLLRARDRLLHWALVDAPRNPGGIVYHLLDAPQFWVDSFYMLPPFLARAGCFSEAMRQIDGYWNALFDPARGLLSHQWDDGRKQFLRKAAWGVGNGWAAAGMARVIAMLPPGMDDTRKKLIARTNGLIRRVLSLQRPDGMFHDVLDDPSTFPEINCGQMIAYTIYRGVQEGWLGWDLIPAAERIRSVAESQVDRFGFVQNVCGAPTFDRPGMAPEGQAFFILMEAAASVVR
jgi:rhamnogalacturonyl hydrolase YesR